MLMQQRLMSIVGKTIFGALAVLMVPLGPAAKAATLLSPEPSSNARVLRLRYAAHPEDRSQIVVTATSPVGGPHIDVYAADQTGSLFRQIGSIFHSQFATGLCCGTLYELPHEVGTLPQGTLLWAASMGQKPVNRPMAIKIYGSQDEGRTWCYLSAIGSPNKGGIWEPEFALGRDDALIMFFSDETDKKQYSQTIKEVRTYDGVHRRDMDYVVASDVRRGRPGMPAVRLLSDGKYIMTFEMGGPARFIVYYRLSDDGWNRGNPADVGAEIRLPNGAFPAHAPRFTVMPDGAILLAAQLIATPQLTLGPRNGRVLLVNRAGNPATPWRTIGAPVPVPDACSETCRKYQWCPNYSPALLPSENGRQVLEFASSWTGSECMTSYAWAPWPSAEEGSGN
jgi:hypothetical protein